MIARIWHGTVPAEKSDAYSQYLRETGLKDYETAPGNRGVYLLRKSDREYTHFITLTFWCDMDAIKKFAGPEIKKARYYKMDSDFLIEQEPFVSHYEIIEPPDEGTDETSKLPLFLRIFCEWPLLYYR
jgi:heme-degrading monooxygenase HmoA